MVRGECRVAHENWSGRQMQGVRTVVAIVLGFVCGEANARVATGTPFADNMVLQRGVAVPVWGTAAPGEPVKVEFAGQSKTVKADAAGLWRVSLDPMSASSENRTMKVFGAEGGEEIKNVLVGEVWFASGQSNMECPIWGANPRYRDGKGGVMVQMTHRPLVRYAKNDRACSAEPEYGWKAEWRDFSPESFAWYCYNPDKSGPRGFEIAGEDGKFVAAELMNRLSKNGTVQGKELVVAAKDVPNPCRLRYLGGAHRAGSIYSLDSGLPPAPFEIGN